MVCFMKDNKLWDIFGVIIFLMLLFIIYQNMCLKSDIKNLYNHVSAVGHYELNSTENSKVDAIYDSINK